MNDDLDSWGEDAPRGRQTEGFTVIKPTLGEAATEGLREKVVVGLGELFEGARSTVWIDFSDHSNVGDSAIWLGQLQLMRELGIDIAAVLPTAVCTPGVVGSTLSRFPEATVGIQGGGNFGGLYANHHAARLAGLRASTGRTVVQAPQSVHFVDKNAKEELTQALAVPQRVQTAVRDQRSVTLLQDLAPSAILVPDVAHCIKGLVASPPVKAVQILRRTDREAPADTRAGEVDLAGKDWIRDGRLQRLAWAARSSTYRLPAARTIYGHVPISIYNRIAHQRVARGVSYLAKGQTILTDRLHAMILGMHIGRRIIAVDNSIGKLGAYYQTWLADTEANVTVVASWDDAFRLARSEP